MTDKEQNNNIPPENHTDEPEKTPVQEIVDEILEGLPEWLREPLAQNFRQIFAAIACVMVAVALWSGYTGYVERGENIASASLGTALHTPDPEQRIELLEKVVKEHGRSDAGEHAVLLLGAAARDAGDLEQASRYFAKARSRFSKESPLYYSAVMGLGYVKEEQDSPGEAKNFFKQAADSAAGYETVALLDLARVCAASGDTSGALEAYEKFMAAAPMSSQLDFVRFEIMQLSAKSDDKDKAKQDQQPKSAS